MAKSKVTINKAESGTGVVPDPEADRLKEVLDNFSEARNYAKDGYFDIWDDCWLVYNNQRTERSNYEGIAETFVPETFTIIESVLANVTGGKPRFEYLPTRNDQNSDAKVLNSLVDFYWEQNRLGLKIIPWVRDSLMYGTGVVFTTWGANGLQVQHIPLKDFFIDPNARVLNDRNSTGNAQFAGFRFLTTLDKLKAAKIVNPDFDPNQPERPRANPRLIPMYQNLNELKKTERRQSDDPLDKEEKDMFFGSTLGGDAKDKQIECIYYVDHERLIVVANRKVLIRNEETPFQRKAETKKAPDDEGNEVEFELPAIEPFLPFAPLRNYIDGSLFYGKGDVEVILDSQEHLNDTAAQKIDNFSYANNNLFYIDPAYSDKAEEFDTVPGAKWFVPPGAVQEKSVTPIGPDADNEMLRVKDEMRRATAADEIVQGAGQDKGRITATEVRAQLAQAGTRFSTKLSVLEHEGYSILASIFFKLIQINVTKEIAVRIIGPKGVEWRNYNPGEYLGDYDPKVTLDTTARSMKLEERQKFIDFYAMASKLPFVDQRQLFKDTAEKVFDMDPDNIDALVVKAPPPDEIANKGIPEGVTGDEVDPEVLKQIIAKATGPGQEQGTPTSPEEAALLSG